MRFNRICRVIITFFLLALLLPSPVCAAEKIPLRVNQANDDNARYAMKMLHLALSKIDNTYNIEIDGTEISQARNITDVAENHLDVMWAATNQAMEDQLQPVRIPLYKGLLGHRIFIINPAAQAKFDKIKTFDDLKTISLGQGTTWADSDILASNGLKVVRVNKYPSLFYMVDGDRFDAFPRGVQEPWGELASRPELSLAVEKHIMLVYRMPFYLFTGKHNKTLAADLEMGLNRAIADGSFDKVFFDEPMVKDVLLRANLEKRLIFNLKNPTLPKDTPVERAELWLDFTKLKPSNASVSQPLTNTTETPPISL